MPITGGAASRHALVSTEGSGCSRCAHRFCAVERGLADPRAGSDPRALPVPRVPLRAVPRAYRARGPAGCAGAPLAAAVRARVCACLVQVHGVSWPGSEKGGALCCCECNSVFRRHASLRRGAIVAWCTISGALPALPRRAGNFDATTDTFSARSPSEPALGEQPHGGGRAEHRGPLPTRDLALGTWATGLAHGCGELSRASSLLSCRGAAFP